MYALFGLLDQTAQRLIGGIIEQNCGFEVKLRISGTEFGQGLLGRTAS